MLPTSRFTNISFSVKGDKEVIQESVVDIMNPELFSGDRPFPGGVYDFRLGTTDNRFRCNTCFHTKDKCLGHPGQITLNYPVFNPMAAADIPRCLTILCHNCGGVFIPEDRYIKFPPAARFNAAKKIAAVAVGSKKEEGTEGRSRGVSKNCVRCGAEHPRIRKDPYTPFLFVAEYYTGETHRETIKLFPHIVASIFERVSDATMISLGRHISSHPRNYVLHHLPVPPTNIRPDVRKVGSSSRSSNDSITVFIHNIIKDNAKITSDYPSPMTVDFEKLITELNNKVHQMVRGSKANQPAIAQSTDNITYAIRWTGKKGRFRKDQMGKRVRKMGRSTIIGDPTLKPYEISIPAKFARTVQRNVVVRDYNRAELMQFIENGDERYPGASRIYSRRGGHGLSIRDAKRAGVIVIEDGDIVTIDHVDGDTIGFNRAPSLFISNISNMTIRVTPDTSETDRTDESKLRPPQALGHNVVACPWFNSDFDGDAMSVIYYSSASAAHEANSLGAPSNWFMTYANGTTSIGQADDSIIGMYQLTKNSVRIDKYHAMMIFQRSSYLPAIEEDRIYTGKEVISMSMEETPINFSGRPTYYNPNLAAFIKYDPEDINTRVVEGKLTSGVLDAAAVGKGGAKNLYQIIGAEYGPKRALDSIFDMQQVVVGYLYQFGYTIGVMDMLVSEAARKEIFAISNDLVNKSRLITEKLNNGEIIPPIGRTVEDFYEEQQIAALNVIDDFTEPILKSVDPDANNLLRIIQSGSKGKLANMYNMVSTIGQKVIDGERIRQVFGYKRTMAYYPRFDTEPEARGFIANSYMSGVTSAEYVSGAIAARFDLITKALSTSVTGAQNRRSIKNLETIIINNLRCAAKDNHIIQLVFGEDYMDVRRVEPVNFPTVTMSDAEFDKQYKREDAAEYKMMLADRVKYRESFLRIERVMIGIPMVTRKKVAFDMGRIIESALFADFKARMATPPSKTEIATMVETVRGFLATFAYAITNERARARGWVLPEHLVMATWLHCMHVRTHLCSARFAEGYESAIGVRGYMNSAILNIVLNNVITKYKAALIEAGSAAGIIAAQSFSEPLTQYMLDAHHRSATGGTSNDAMTKSNEVLGAKVVSKLSMPRMVVSLLPDVAGDARLVQEIANNIEALHFRQFVTKYAIFFEKFGEPVHPAYAAERDMIAEFVKKNPLVKAPIDLVRWCVRYVINKTSLILKNIALDVIIERIREAHPECYVVYTPENSGDIIIRMYVRAAAFKDVHLASVKDYSSKVLECAVRGVSGIINTEMKQIINSRVEADGSVVQNNDNWGISTVGTNLATLLTLNHIDRYSIHTDAIQEVVDIFGIEAARLHIMQEMKVLAEKCDSRHLTIYADEMTYTGAYTSIDKSGIDKREERNILLRVGTSSPVRAVESAAITSATDMVAGVTSSFLLGTVPRIGSIYNGFIVNEEFVKNNTVSDEAILDEL